MKFFTVLIILSTLTGCADKVPFDIAAQIEPVGFFYGLWHGFIVLFSWIGSWFFDDVAIYAIYNNGGWYDFGFIIGFSSACTSCYESNKS
jgi:hypothetical protein